ncbi:MAG: hypothetical protein ICV74_03530 [Thermoleophilia bacterium]|nr:hypothetical protein [Thermoleophilia bacterium]
MSERERRVGKNEALFREVNERIREITTYGGDVEFLCECGDPTCARPILMTIAEYEAVRANAARFFVVRGHEIADVETVVDENDRFAVVEKHAGFPTNLAVERDPRS